MRTVFASLIIAATLAAGCGSRMPAPTTGALEPVPVTKQQDDAGDRAALRAKLVERRRMQIARLKAYRDSGVYPRQREQRNVKVNLFIDDDGRLCAIANLIALDGRRGLVELVAHTNNTLRMAEVKDGVLMDWMLESGLTQEEIAFIQEPYYYDEGSPEARKWETDRLNRHFDEALAQLEANFDASIDLAVDRAMAQR